MFSHTPTKQQKEPMAGGGTQFTLYPSYSQSSPRPITSPQVHLHKPRDAQSPKADGNPNEGFRGRDTLSRLLPGNSQPYCSGVTPTMSIQHRNTFWTEGCKDHGVWDTLLDAGEEHFEIV